MEDLERHLQRQLNWISAADTKTTYIFAIDMAMLGALAAVIPERAAWPCFSAVVAILAFLLLLGSILGLAFATFPRTSGPSGSLLFFGTICKYKEDEFIRKINEPPGDLLRQDYAGQIYRNAQIANTKYWCVKIAMYAMFFAVVPWLLAICFLY